jgi:hypothetical protein
MDPVIDDSQRDAQSQIQVEDPPVRSPPRCSLDEIDFDDDDDDDDGMPYLSPSDFYELDKLEVGPSWDTNYPSLGSFGDPPAPTNGTNADPSTLQVHPGPHPGWENVLSALAAPGPGASISGTFTHPRQALFEHVFLP